jgi:hypothetical protein
MKSYKEYIAEELASKIDEEEISTEELEIDDTEQDED